MIRSIATNWSYRMQISPTAPFSQDAITPKTTRLDDGLRVAARDLEATFIAEMLNAAGVGRVPDAFGGGAGETQFASYLRHEQARAMAEAGGIGLAEHIFRALKSGEAR
jgi:Rod binding domain-containing protein